MPATARKSTPSTSMGIPVDPGAVVAQWQQRVADFSDQLDLLRQRLAETQVERNQKALAAKLGDPRAIAALTEIRKTQFDLTAEIDELEAALAAARNELFDAQADANAAAKSARYHAAQDAACRRIDLAEKLDMALAGLQELATEFEEVGKVLATFVDVTNRTHNQIASATKITRAVWTDAPALARVLDLPRSLAGGVALDRGERLTLGEMERNLFAPLLAD